ncbi:ROK family transcriptional regulator [Paractinoplanes brasiliensis]|uniref:Putative NBD/HSP70 family sugar kinase n=1 Tax=Paractinoplanes brasiliensis TaxID=52695 RepID=A0A4R6JQJ2_9ACTN|nr:ROK family transcriptional regulator [Actinoplanes brasiliensis]TDO37972.1 putative NBD/HSP70 family sugar kinase [Actinoplanes brasiliensis]GID31063.1 transcriptional regulator [Actinoplanes brasiliensis]
MPITSAAALDSGLTGTEQAVLRALSDGRQRTVAELCAELSAARSSVVHALNSLRTAGVVVEHPSGRSARGRPARGWSVAASPGLLAVVLAAAHGFLAGVVRPDGEVLAAVHGAADFTAPAAALELLGRAVAEAGVTHRQVELAVLGLPGPSMFARTPGLDSFGGSHLRRFRDWDGRPAADVVSEYLDRPVFCENDANLAALGEAVYGDVAGLHTVLHISLTHGTGAGLVIGGKLHRGGSRLAGEVGHLHVDDGGQLCECGARGCFWQTTSIPALLNELATAHGKTFTVSDLDAAAALGELEIVRALRGFGRSLGRRVADFVVFLDPQAIVVDCTLGAASDVIADGIREAVDQYAPPMMAASVKISSGSLGASAHLKGAAALVRTEHLLDVSRLGLPAPA